MKYSRIKAAAALVAAATLVVASAMIFSGCSHLASGSRDDTAAVKESPEVLPEGDGLAGSDELADGDGLTGGDDLGEGSRGETGAGESGIGEAESASGEDTLLPSEALTEPDVPRVQQKIVTVTDIHYLAESFSGNRGPSFMAEVESGDGRVLQYGPEILDAFIEDMRKEKPDLIIMSGDLTLDGEKKSHEELAEKLEILLDNGITVLVIPGNHDINNPEAKKFTSDGTEKVPSVTALEFAEIYDNYGYGDASERDPASLSYVYELDDYYRILMLDSCQYDPVNLIGGMIRRETYDWIGEQMEAGWEEGAQFISVSHHNLLDQSGVSRDFYDNCTIEHNEELVQALGDGEVRLHLSGHLHLQHYLQDEDYGIYEIVTGSLVMTPCHYGVIKIMDTGSFLYDAKPVDVNGWAKRHSYRNRDLADFTAFGEGFLHKVSYQNALKDLRQHTMNKRLLLSDERMNEMADFYARLCVYYYSGRMVQIAEGVKKENAYRYWNEVNYISDLSDFLYNILSDEAKDFSHLEIPY